MFMQVINYKIEDLKPYKRNPRKNDGAVDAVAACIIADDLTPDQIKAFRLADNKTAELADWDFELLQLELSDIQLDMTDFGFDTTLPGEAYEDNYEPEPPEEPKAKLGDMYKLGAHTLLCGDATSALSYTNLGGGGGAL